jgi:hypothetical protein
MVASLYDELSYMEIFVVIDTVRTTNDLADNALTTIDMTSVNNK